MTCQNLQLQRLEAGGWKVPPAGTSGRSPGAAAAAPATTGGASAGGGKGGAGRAAPPCKMEGLDFRSRSKSVGEAPPGCRSKRTKSSWLNCRAASCGRCNHGGIKKSFHKENCLKQSRTSLLNILLLLG